MRSNVKRAYKQAEKRRRMLREIEARAAGQSISNPLCQQCRRQTAKKGTRLCGTCSAVNRRAAAEQARRRQMQAAVEVDSPLPEAWSGRWRVV
jgi:predicted secreted Zn-dependent protease